MSESALQVQWAYSNKRQSAYAVPNPNADIDQGHPFESIEFGEHNPNMSDNMAQYGKGHEFATRNEILSWDTRFKRTFQATTKALGWSLAFHCGKCTTAPLGGGAYSHVMEYQDPLGTGYYGLGRQLPVTTIMERVTSGYVRRFPSMQVKSIEMTGTLNDWVKLAIELQGSGMKSDIVPSGFTFPEATEGTLLRNASLAMTTGPSGNQDDISCDIRDWRFRSEYSFDEPGGYCPGSGYLVDGLPSSGQIRNRLEFMRRAVMFEFTVRADASSTYFTRLEGSVETSALVTITGDEIGTSGFDHLLAIELTRLKYKTVPIGQQNDVITYHVTTLVFFDLNQGTNTEMVGNPFKLTVQNDVAAYLVSS